MWELRPFDSNKTTSQSFFLVGGQTYTVGRRDCDIALNDQSVSRRHAELKVENVTQKTKGSFTSDLILSDQSKFGTFLVKPAGEARCEPGITVDLHDGDVVKFGLTDGVFQVHWSPVIMCLSSNVKHKDRLPIPTIGSLWVPAIVCNTLPGYITEDIQQMTHLVTEEILLTPKLLLALGRTVPVVSTAWVQAASLKYPTIIKGLPDFSGFLPPPHQSAADALLNIDLSPKKERSVLFRGLRFIVLEQSQYTRISGVIESCSGKVWTWLGETEPPVVPDQEERICAIIPDECPPLSLQKLSRLKEEFSATCLQEDDIGLAILRMEKLHVPDYTLDPVAPSVPSQSDLQPQGTPVPPAEPAMIKPVTPPQPPQINVDSTALNLKRKAHESLMQLAAEHLVTSPSQKRFKKVW